jgi:hypothetical protein
VIISKKAGENIIWNQKLEFDLEFIKPNYQTKLNNPIRDEGGIPDRVIFILYGSGLFAIPNLGD